jgi:hypothetical protein
MVTLEKKIGKKPKNKGDEKANGDQEKQLWWEGSLDRGATKDQGAYGKYVVQKQKKDTNANAGGEHQGVRKAKRQKGKNRARCAAARAGKAEYAHKGAVKGGDAAFLYEKIKKGNSDGTNEQDAVDNSKAKRRSFHKLSPFQNAVNPEFSPSSLYHARHVKSSENKKILTFA